MYKDQRVSSGSIDANNKPYKPNTSSSPGNFEYIPPNNSGTTLSLLGGVLSTVGGALSTIGGIIQFNTELSDDFQSQVDDYRLDQKKEKMQAEIIDLQEKVKQLEQLIKNNSN